MDSKRLIIVVVLSTAVVFGWAALRQYMRDKHPEWFPESRQDGTPTTQVASEGTGGAGVAASMPATRIAAPVMTSAGGLRVVGATKAAAPYKMGYDEYDPKGAKPFPISVMASPRGAGLESVTLTRFTQEVGKKLSYVFQKPYAQGNPAMGRALATRTLVVNGVSNDVAEVDWVQKPDVGGMTAMVEYGVDIAGVSGGTILSVEKKYALQGTGDTGEGYEVLVSYTYRNPTTQPVRVKTIFNGPNVPEVENSRDIPEVVVGLNDDMMVSLDHRPASGITPEKGVVSLKSSKGFPLLWAGVASAYFNAIVRPEVDKQGKSSVVADVTAQALAKQGPNGEAFIALTFETGEVTVPARGQVTVPFHVYMGPRQRAVLNKAHYTAFPLSYDKALVLTGGMCAFCTFQWLINILVLMLTGFHWLFGGFAEAGDWGLAIIALVLVVRLLLHPITKRSQISMSKMSRMGPEIEKLKQKHGDNKEELNKAMMVFYKEQGATPILGCLPMLLQMPIWIALWSALQSTFELRHASFLWGFTWMKDLAQPDRLWFFPQKPINLYFFALDSINLLPILMAVVFWLQQKMTPKPVTTTKEAEQQQKMMQWMTLLFPLLLYTGPSGLNLYILTSTAIGIWESKRVRDHIQAQEEAERAGKVIVGAKATRASRRHAKDDQVEEPKRGGLMGWLAGIQKKA